VTSSNRVTLARFWAIGIAVLSFLPWLNWISGGHEAPWYAVSASEWLNGSAISLGFAVVLFLAVRRSGWWPTGWARVADAASRRVHLTALLLGLAALALFACVALVVLDGRPLHIDEIVQVFQGRIFAEGLVSLPADPYPEFFGALNVVDVNGAVYSQFPPGGPLMLVPGVLVGLPWLTGPVFGAIAVVTFWYLVRSTEETSSGALGAAALLAGAPFLMFMAGSHMNHVPTLAWLCLALLGLRLITTVERAQVAVPLATGFALGMVLSIRPMDGAAFAVPAGIWLLARKVSGHSSLRTLIASGIGVVIPVAGMLAYNAATTGSAALFGYELLWGASHSPGFHRAPWGATHTPARGFELVNLYFLRLQNYLFETPLPSLVPALVGLALVRRLNSFDRYLLASSALLVLGYFVYWHDGFYLGPRFLYLLLPVFVIWTARLPAIVRDRFPSRVADRFVLLAYGVSAVVGVVSSLPVRVRQYSNSSQMARHDYLAPAAAGGVGNALIFVRESWGAQIIARLWGLGVSRSESEALYRTVDTCLLDSAIAGLEAEGVRDAAAVDRLRPLARDSSRLLASTLSPDRSERMLPAARYSPTCQRRVFEDRGGFASFAPLLARDVGSNVYARDLHARDTLLLQRFVDRPVYLLRTQSSEPGLPLMLERLSVDSARAEWALSASGR
jgi:hypothetical protein